MIKYDTGSILTKAKELSDLVNSDFISYNEEMTLLNDAYMRLYQTSINAGDLLYLKSIALEDSGTTINDQVNDPESDLYDINNKYKGQYVEENVKRYLLPDDFYQMYSLKYKECGGSCSFPLPRKTKNQTTNVECYELRNNYLYVYGNASSITLEYFPIPETLYTESRDINLPDLEGLGEVVSLYKDKILAWDKENCILNLISLDTEELLTSWLVREEKGLDISRAYMSETGVAVIFNESDTSVSENPQKVFEVSYNKENTPYSLINLGNRIPVLEDGIISFRDQSSGDTETSKLKSISIKDDEVNSVTWVREEEEILGHEYLNDEIMLDGFGNSIIKDLEDKIFILSAGGVLQIYDKVKEKLEIPLSSNLYKVIAVSDYNMKTGYGYLVDKRGKGLYIKSCFKNTKLEYPNNLYFSLLSYMLAISYKTKQNADTSQLVQSYNDALSQYYDMFQRDVNCSLRVNNIY